MWAPLPPTSTTAAQKISCAPAKQKAHHPAQMSVSAASPWPADRLHELWRRSYYGSHDEQAGGAERHEEDKRKRWGREQCSNCSP